MRCRPKAIGKSDKATRHGSWLNSFFGTGMPLCHQTKDMSMDQPRKAQASTQSVVASLYFWWMAFLRCSKDYWWCCQQQGQCQDPRLVQVWRDFGDIFQPHSMMNWWQAQGALLFDSPQVEMDFHKVLASGVELLLAQDLTSARPGMLCVAIPLSLDPLALMEAMQEAWTTAHIRGHHFSPRDARYRLASSSIKSKRMVISAYQSWVLNTTLSRVTVPLDAIKWGGYEMGRHLNLSPRNAPLASDALDQARLKQNNVRTVFCQHKRAANELIANVEIGRFPCKAAVALQPRWNPRQQQDLDQAVRDGAWLPSNWLRLEHAFLLPEHVLTTVDHSAMSPHALDLAAVTDFGALATPFLQPKRVRARRSPA